jgi:hypothetical protein
LGADASSAAALAKSFGVAWPDVSDPLDQAVAEALTMVETYQLMLADLAEVAPGVAPQSCWSAGSIITAALRRAGVRAPAESTATLPRWVLGACAAAFHGGRVEALLVGTPMPMAMVDLNGTYPAMFSLLGLTPHLAADHFEVEVVAVEEVEALFAPEGFRDRLDDREWWAKTGGLFGLVEPHGELLPCVREAGERWRSVTAPLDLAGGSLWYHAADLVRPALAGKLPKILSAFRVLAVGTAPGLRPPRLPSGQECGLAAGDYGQALCRERQLAHEIEDDLPRWRRESQAKGVSVSGAWGIFARVDQRQVASTQESVALGPDGERLAKRGRRVDRAGPLTLWHIASAIPAACRAIIGMAQHDVEAAGGTVAAVLTDCLVLAAAPDARLEHCPGGPRQLPRSQEAVRLLSHEQLRAILRRFDTLLHPDGGEAWKAENGTLDNETLGLVVGLNKVLLGRDEGSRWGLVRSSDTSLGDHFEDPTGTNQHLPDGRLAWSAELEGPLLADALERGVGAPLRVPDDLPAWADQLALRPERATTMADVRRVRAAAADEGIPPFAHYFTAGDFDGDSPVCLAHGQDQATWQERDWWADGQPCRVAVQLPDGTELRSRTPQLPKDVRLREFYCATIRDKLADWLREYDPTVAGPQRGLRHVLPVHSHPALIELVGRSGEAAGDLASDDPVVYGQAANTEELLREAIALGSGELARRGVAGRTAKYVAAGRRPRLSTVATLAAAVAEGKPDRRCAGCGTELVGRAAKRWCSDRCRMTTARATKPAPAAPPVPAPDNVDLDRALDLLAALPGMPPAPLGLRAVGASKKLRGLVEECLAAPGVSPELLAQRVGADGPLAGRSPVGILASRLKNLAATLPVEAADLAAGREEGARRWGALLGAMVRAGGLHEDAALEELAHEPDGALRQRAANEYLSVVERVPV